MKSQKTKDMERCHKKWACIIKHLADYKSEWSGKTERLNAHHLEGKTNNRLRFELKNGVCLTAGEHHYIAHRADRVTYFKNVIYDKREHGLREFLDRLKHLPGVSKLRDCEFFLDCKIKELGVKL